MPSTQRYCPNCKHDVTPGQDDLQGWYWLCPACRKAVTTTADRYCPGCKSGVVAWAWGPNMNLVDPRPWWSRDPWFCATCSTTTHGSQFGATVSKIWHFILGTILALVLLAMAIGVVVALVQGKFK